MTIRGRIRGKMIELAELLPYAEGQEVTVSIEPTFPPATSGSPETVLEALRRPPHVDSETVDLLDRLIEEGKLPVGAGGIFDSDSER